MTLVRELARRIVALRCNAKRILAGWANPLEIVDPGSVEVPDR